MGIFDKKTEKKTTTPRTKASSGAKGKKAHAEDRTLTPGGARIDQAGKGTERYASYIKQPRITEKASFAAGAGAYTFTVRQDATKLIIKHAIKEIYNVEPRKVNIIVQKPHAVRVRGKMGVRSGWKKAMVFLKKGDKIEFV